MLPSLLETNSILATAYAVIIYSMMLTAAFFLLKFQSISKGVTPFQNRYGSLDGFRGVLAVGVFVHHSFAAYGYFTHGRWEWSKSAILNHLGQTTVALFFMITGFLFALKSMSLNIDWKAFFVSRIARLFPLYATVVCVLFFTVFLLSHGVLREPGWKILKELIQWLTFVVFGRPNINALADTYTLIAGVNWSLKYEVMFYVLCVPMLHFLSRIFSSRTMLFMTVTLLSGLLSIRYFRGEEPGEILYATHFLCGIVIAYAYKEPRFLKLIQSRPFRIAAGASLLILFFLENAYGCASILITIAIFSAVVGGLSIWGLLNTRAALWLGDISYGIYLIHGLTLWLIYFALKSYGNLPGVGLLEYGALMVCVGVVVVALASLSYLKIEKPIMALAKK